MAKYTKESLTPIYKLYFAVIDELADPKATTKSPLKLCETTISTANRLSTLGMYQMEREHDVMAGPMSFLISSALQANFDKDFIKQRHPDTVKHMDGVLIRVLANSAEPFTKAFNSLTDKIMTEGRSHGMMNSEFETVKREKIAKIIADRRAELGLK